MVWLIVALSGAVMLVLSVAMACVLGWAHRVWRVEEDPRVEAISEALPGINCGACGYPGCHECAVAMAVGEAPAGACPVGGPESAKAIAAILGVALEFAWSIYAIVHCGARAADRAGRREYRGVATCAGADVVSGVQACVYGCLGLGDCERACGYDAIHVVDGLAAVDYEKCVGCGACVRACPRKIIETEPFRAGEMLVVACCNRDPGKETRGACKVGCIACGLCERASDLFSVEKGLSKLDYSRYDPTAHREQLEAAAAKCPAGCLPFRGKKEN